MNNIIPLIQNENMKLYRRLITWVLISIIVVVNLVMAIVMATLDERPADHAYDFVSMSFILFFFVVIFTVVVAAGIVASEFSWGTIKLLLTRPVSRTKILLSKYIATLLFSLFITVILIVCSFIIGFLFFGTSGETTDTIGGILKDYAIGSIDMVMTVTFAFMISTVFRSNVLAIILSFIILFFAGNVMGLLSYLKLNWGKYILFANTDLAQYTGDNKPLFEGMTLGFSITIIVIYFIIFNLISWYVFNKRDVSV